MTATQSIQPAGFHLSLSSDWRIDAVSANLGDFLGFAPEAVLGQQIDALLSDNAIHDVRNRMTLLRGDDAVEHLFHYPLAADGGTFDLAIHRNGTGFAIDGEPCCEHSIGDATGILAGMLSRIEATNDVGQLCDQACNQLRALTGYQQVVIVAGHALLGQSRRSGTAPFGTAISAIGSDLMVFDRDAATVPIRAVDAGWSMPTGSLLRSPPNAQRARLETIGARAAFIIPLDRDGRTWGEAACFHALPRQVSAERRNIARLFAGFVSLRIELAEQKAARG